MFITPRDARTILNMLPLINWNEKKVKAANKLAVIASLCPACMTNEAEEGKSLCVKCNAELMAQNTGWSE